MARLLPVYTLIGLFYTVSSFFQQSKPFDLRNDNAIVVETPRRAVVIMMTMKLSQG